MSIVPDNVNSSDTEDDCVNLFKHLLTIYELLKACNISKNFLYNRCWSPLLTWIKSASINIILNMFTKKIVCLQNLLKNVTMLKTLRACPKLSIKSC